MRVLAHPISLSSSELRMEDGIVRLFIRLPKDELDHVPLAERSLPSRFRINGESPVSQSCNFTDSDYECWATFVVPDPVDIFCDLTAVVVPHHVHTMQTPDGALIFTNLVTEQQLQHRAIPWWLLGVFLLVVVLSIRLWRRRTSHQG